MEDEGKGPMGVIVSVSKRPNDVGHAETDLEEVVIGLKTETRGGDDIVVQTMTPGAPDQE